MGVCWTENKNQNSANRNNATSNNQIMLADKQYIKNTFNDEKFKDMPLYPGEKYKGYGIKEMRAYKCDLPIDELIKMRESFWKSKSDHFTEWQIVHQACVFDHIKAEEFLLKNKFKTLNGCINQCVDKNNNIYCVPNFCINDPYFELEVLPEDDSRNNQINIVLMDICNGNSFKTVVPENIKGSEIKMKFAEKHNIDLNKNKIRLLFGGGIIKDDECLYQHKIKDGFSIQICITPIIE